MFQLACNLEENKIKFCQLKNKTKLFPLFQLLRYYSNSKISHYNKSFSLTNNKQLLSKLCFNNNNRLKT